MAGVSAEAKIEDALFRHLKAFQPTLPTAYPNRAFTPPTAGMYLGAVHQPNATDQVTLGDAGSRRLLGLLQIDVMDRENAGTLPSREVAGALCKHFDAALRLGLAADGLFVMLERPSYAVSPIQSDGWLQTPVTVRYYADAPIN